jgi:hypothetical protein
VRITIEPPDVLFVAYVGDLDGPDILASEPEGVRLSEKLPYHLLLIDVSQLKSFSADARRVAAHSGGKTKSVLRGMAIFGASFHYRAIGTLIAKAAAILYRHENNPLRFFNTEAEARVWIAERQQVLTKM